VAGGAGRDGVGGVRVNGEGMRLTLLRPAPGIRIVRDHLPVGDRLILKIGPPIPQPIPLLDCVMRSPGKICRLLR
jgi:hypothetical protein